MSNFLLCPDVNQAWAGPNAIVVCPIITTFRPSDVDLAPALRPEAKTTIPLVKPTPASADAKHTPKDKTATGAVVGARID